MAQRRSNTPRMARTTAWVQDHADGSATLGRMIEEAFPDEESLYPSKDDSSSEHAPELEASKSSDKSASLEKKHTHAKDALPPINFARYYARIRQNMPLTDTIHPWCIVDYHRLMKFVGANSLDTHRAGALMITDTWCRFIEYDEIYGVTAKDCPPNPKLVFARIPLFNKEEGAFGRERYVMAYNINSEEISVRLFEHPPVDIYEIGGYWEEGKDVYLFNLEEIYTFIRGSVDDEDGEMIFPHLSRTEHCLDKSRKDHPGLQLVILSQCATFMANVSRVLLIREKGDSGVGKHRAAMLRTIKRWHDIAERASVDMWAAYRAGTSKEDYLAKVDANRLISDFLGFKHDKVRQQTVWVNPDLPEPDPSPSSSNSLDSAEERCKERKREEQAIRRVKERFSNLFQKPTEDGRSNWEGINALDAIEKKDVGSKAKDHSPVNEELSAKVTRSFRDKQVDTVKHAPAKPRTVPVDEKPLNEKRTATTTTPGSSEQTAAGGNGEKGNESDQDHDNWLARPPVTSLSDLLDCILKFVNEHPQMNNASNRIKCRTMLADMGITVMERRHRSLEVTAHPFDERVRGTEEHARDIAEMEFDLESNAGEDYVV